MREAPPKRRNRKRQEFRNDKVLVTLNLELAMKGILAGENLQSATFQNLTDTIRRLEEENNDLKARLLEISNEPRYLVLHFVLDIEPGEKSWFLDEPRMWAGDNMSSDHLRGLNSIPGHKVYSKTHPEISFFIIKEYENSSYQKSLPENLFRAQAITRSTKVDMRQPESIEDSSGRLLKDGPTAKASSERIVFTSDLLMNALEKIAELVTKNGEFFKIPEKEICPPYPFLYHHVSTMKRYKQALDETLCKHIESLIQYADKECSGRFGYDEARLLFSRGLVSARHLTKLFLPGEVVVTRRGGRSFGYIVDNYVRESARGLCTLYCWSWDFIGLFQRKEHSFNIELDPHLEDTETQPVTSLEAYPERYEAPGVIDALRSRGETVWSCRRGRNVSYSGRDLNEEEHDVCHPKICRKNKC